MKLQIIIQMLFDLLEGRRLTAKFFAEKYALSTRTAYRYLRELSKCVPLEISRGRAGGICLPERFKLPMDFLSENEFEATMYALDCAYAKNPSRVFFDAKEKIYATKTQDGESF